MNCCPRLLWMGVCLSLVIPVTANAYYVDSYANDEMDNPIPVHFDTSGGAIEYRLQASMTDEQKAAVDAAFATWSAVECSTLMFVKGPDEENPDPFHYQMDTPDVYVLVYFDDEPTTFSNNQVGVTQVGHDIDTSTLIGTSVVLNAANHSWSTTGEAGMLDLQSVATALIGRSMGITSTMEGNATYPSYGAGDTSKRTLGADDIAAIQFVYGDDSCMDVPDPEMICAESTPDCPPPINTNPGGDGGVGPGTDGGPGTGGTLDAGTGGTGGTDAGGTMGTLDAGGGMTGGGGDEDDDDGCGCRIIDDRSSTIPTVLMVIGLAFAIRRRR